MGLVNLKFDPKHLEQTKSDLPLFSGGECIRVEVSWFEKYPLERLSLSLLRHTTGKGFSSSIVAHSVEIETEHITGEQWIDLTLPDGPATYHGKLLSISWKIQVSLSDSQVSKEKSFYLNAVSLSSSSSSHQYANS